MAGATNGLNPFMVATGVAVKDDHSIRALRSFQPLHHQHRIAVKEADPGTTDRGGVMQG